MRLGRLMDDTFFTKAARSIIDAYRGEVERSPASCLWLIMAEEDPELADSGTDHA
jgi:hypothetical protein